MFLTIRTDKPEAEIGLYDGANRASYEAWQAHRELSRTIHVRIRQLLDEQGLDWADINGIVFYKGPGSFTGLRIGAAVANSLAFANGIQVASAGGDDWIGDGIAALHNGHKGTAVPEYGAAPHITQQKK